MEPPDADRRRPPVRLRALRAPARAAAVRALALGAVARRDDDRRRLAALAPPGGRALRLHAAEFGHRLFGLAAPERGPDAGSGDLRPGDGRARSRSARSPACWCRARSSAPRRRPSGNTFARERWYHRPRRGVRRPPIAPSRAARAARRDRLQLPLVVDARRPRAVRLHRPRALGGLRRPTRSACCRRSTPTGSPRSPADAAFTGRLEALRETLETALAEDTLEGDGHARRARGVLLRRVRRPRVAARLLGRPRRARRRHPQGGLRPGAAARGRRPDVPPRLLPPAHRRLGLAARVLGRDGPRPRARRAGHRLRRRARHRHRPARRPRARRPDLARRRRPRPAAAARRRPPRERPSRTAGSPRACTSATATCA